MHTDQRVARCERGSFSGKYLCMMHQTASTQCPLLGALNDDEFIDFCDRENTVSGLQTLIGHSQSVSSVTKGNDEANSPNQTN